MTWATREVVRRQWADAPAVDATLDELIDAAHEVVAAYAPALADGEPVPARYVRAEVAMCRDAYMAFKRDTADAVGVDDLGTYVRVRPLSGFVAMLLRPPTTPVVG